MMLEILQRLPQLARPFSRQTSPGSAPGVVVADPEAAAPTIDVVVYDADSISEQHVESLDGLDLGPGQGKVTWINVEGLGDADVIRQLGKQFRLHPLALEDVVHVHQRAKVEDYDHFLFIVARMVTSAEHLQTRQLSLFLGDGFVITFESGPSGACLESLRARLRQNSGRIRRRGADYLAYSLLDAVIDAYFPVLEDYGDRLDQLDDELARQRRPISASQIHQLRSELLHLHRSVWPHREAIAQMSRDPHRLISDETRLYLRDTCDHTFQLMDVMETYRELCVDLRDALFSAMTIRTNEVMKVLTIIATLFIPLSFIASVYGMNFHNMPELSWKYGYPLALGLMGVTSAGLLGFIWKKGWLGE